MKKVLALILVLLMVFGMVACSVAKDDEDEEEEKKKGAEATEVIEEEETPADEDEEEDEDKDEEEEIHKNTNSADDVAEAAIEAYFDGDYVGMAELLYDEVREYYCSDEELQYEDEYLKEEMEEYPVRSYEFVSVSKADDYIEDIEEAYLEDGLEIDVEAVMVYEVEYIYEDEGEIEDGWEEIYIVKIDRAWYLDFYYSDIT